MNDVVTAFHEYFEIIDARSPELLRDVFHLRYRVFCLEQRVPGFEAANYPTEMESDDYDRHSSHILLRHRPSGDFVGTARLVLPDPLNPEKPFPMEQYTQFDPALLDMSQLSRQHTGEISRLVIVRQFARRRSELPPALESGTGIEQWFPTKQRRFPHPMLALVVGIVRMSAEHNITQCLSAMDPSLNRLLGPFGLQFDPVGPMTNHHGPRRPYYIDLLKMLDRTYVNHNHIWELITDHGKVRLTPTECMPEHHRTLY